MKKLFNKNLPECPFKQHATGAILVPQVPMTHPWWQGTGLMVVDPGTQRRLYGVRCKFRGGQGDCQGRREECINE